MRINNKLIAVVFALFVSGLVSAQSVKTSYFIDKSPVRLGLNSAFQPEFGYVNVPVLGNLGVTYTSNSLSADKLFFPTTNGLVTFLDPMVDAQSFLGGLSKNNTVNIDLKASILGGGFWAKNAFWKINIGLNSSTNTNIPKSLFEFAKLGNGYDGGVFDLKDIKAYNETYVDFTVGYSRPINDKWTVGGAVKFLMGVASAESYFDQLQISAMANLWEVESHGTMNVNMKGLSPKLSAGNNPYINGFNYGSFGFSGYGAAIDLGVTFRPIHNLKLSAAINDLGFISWSKASNTYAQASGKFLYSGFDISVDDTSTPVKDQLDSFKDGLLELVHFKPQESRSSTRMITSSFNVGAEYSILKEKIGFGLVYSGRVSPIVYEQELTLISTFRPLHWLSAALSYSFLNSHFDTFGFALNFSPTWINFFVGADYMFTKVSPQFIPLKQTAANIYVGLSIPIGVSAKRSFDLNKNKPDRRYTFDNY